MKIINCVKLEPSVVSEVVFPEIDHLVLTYTLHFQITLSTHIRVKYRKKWYKIYKWLPVKIAINDTLIFEEILLRRKIEFTKECYKWVCSFDGVAFKKVKDLNPNWVKLDEDQREEMERL